MVTSGGVAVQIGLHPALSGTFSSTGDCGPLTDGARSAVSNYNSMSVDAASVEAALSRCEIATNRDPAIRWF